MLLFQILFFAILIWLGLYMLNRDIRNSRFALSGAGLILTAVALGWCTIGQSAHSILFMTFTIIGVGLSVVSLFILKKESDKQGEAWVPDLTRSFDYSFIFTTLFSGQVALVIWLGAEFDGQMRFVLLASIVLSIAFQVFVYPIRRMIDRMAFAAFPNLLQARARLRQVEQVQVHINEEARPDAMTDEELLRHTRVALRNFGNLERLASSPLTRLQRIDRRLSERGGADEVIERAVELKTLLLESIQQLKPRDGNEFGTTDEWRFYNALYFPYIIGVKPFSVRYTGAKLDAPSREALDWFRANVPERTFYNWQNAGAKIIAMNLKEQLGI